jgi:hypothetical protein
MDNFRWRDGIRITRNVRSLDVLDSFLLAQHPLLPVRTPILHCAENDFGDLKTRLSQTN